MTTEELTALNRRLCDNYIKAVMSGPACCEAPTWLTWLFENETLMIGREWAEAWARQAAERDQDHLDFGYHQG